MSQPIASRVPDFANRWEVSEATVWRWIRDGKIAVVRVGQVTRITKQAEQEFLKRFQADGKAA